MYKYLIYNDVLSADKMMEDWFPSIKANVFISHSHKDINLAYGLAGFLHKRLGISSFIDSSVWGYSDNLLKRIDNKYCVFKYYEDGSKTYNYNQRNRTTSHVHIMLNAALMKMMDRTECIIFINSPNTIIYSDEYGKDYTDSPWIYSELLMTKMLRKRGFQEYRHQDVLGSTIGHSERGIQILYKAPTDDLYDLRFADLLETYNSNVMSYDALDMLYKNLDIM